MLYNTITTVPNVFFLKNLASFDDQGDRSLIVHPLYPSTSIPKYLSP